MTPPNSPNRITGPNWASDDETEPERIVGQLKDEPALGDLLHPRPDERDRLAGEEQPVVAVAEGAGSLEGDRHRPARAARAVRGADPRPGRPWSMRGSGSTPASTSAMCTRRWSRRPSASSIIDESRPSLARRKSIWRSTRARASSTIARRSAASVVVRNRARLRVARRLVFEELADLGKAEPGVVAEALDEAQPLDVVGVVLAIVAARPACRLEQPELFVVADRAGREPKLAGDLLDAEQRDGIWPGGLGGGRVEVVEVAHAGLIMPQRCR